MSKNHWSKRPDSEEIKKRIVKSRIGVPLSMEHKLNIGRANMGHLVSMESRRKTGLKNSIKLKGRKVPEDVKLKISNSMKGRPQLWLRNRVRTLEERRKLSESHKGEKAYNWKGGISNPNEILRKSFEYKLWRTAVFERDNFTCLWCGERGGKLNADHIKPFAYFPELRFAIDNGRTLCVSCHKKTDTWGEKAKRYEK